jgi:hypothetical protein
MWSAQSERLLGGRCLKVAIGFDSSPLPFSEALRLLRHDAGFRSYFIALLADAPFSAFLWETPALCSATLDRPFEFVLLDSPGLASEPDPVAFASYFKGKTAAEGVVTFSNLGKDAILIVPCPRGPVSAYGHLAAFVREAPELQQHALWRLVGQTVEQQLGPAPVWLSTAGAGVSWLHVRIDTTPKYYGYGPYRDPS